MGQKALGKKMQVTFYGTDSIKKKDGLSFIWTSISNYIASYGH